MLDKRYIQGIAAVSVTWGLPLWYTSPHAFLQAAGLLLLTIGVPVGIDPLHPSIHRYVGSAFLTWAVLLISATTDNLIFGALGAILLCFGALLHTYSSAIIRTTIGTMLIGSGALSWICPSQLLGEHAKNLSMTCIAIGSMLGRASCGTDVQALFVFGFVWLTFQLNADDGTPFWWKLAGWLLSLDLAFPVGGKVLVRLVCLPAQALLLLVVFIYEAAFTRDDEQIGQALSIDEGDDDEYARRYPTFDRFSTIFASILGRTAHLIFLHNGIDRIQRKQEKTVGIIRRLTLVAVYCIASPVVGVVEFLWMPVFTKFVPTLYAWWNSSIYSSLNRTSPAIRLLILEPGVTDDPIRCSLEAVSVHSLQFEALSYTWGGHYTLRRAITIDDRLFWVTDSVTNALRSLRLSDRRRLLWIDQICINQGDDAEKSDQVGKMRLIYGNAQRVIVWLGKSTSSVSAAFKDLRVALEAQSRQGFLGEVDRTSLWFNIAKSKHTWQALSRRKWWSRVWVVQESLLNRDTMVRCGDDELPWESLSDFADIPKDICDIGPSMRKLLLFSRDFKAGRTDDLDVVDLSIRFMPSDASNSRDRIYGFIGLLRTDGSIGMRVDYSLGINTVFEEYTARYIERTQCLRILSLVESYPAPGSSWSVNYNFGVTSVRTLPFLDQMESSILRPRMALSDASKEYCASGCRPTSYVRYIPDKRTLTLRGWYLDTVKDVACLARPGDFLSCLKSWEQFAQSHSMDWSREKLAYFNVLLGSVEAGSSFGERYDYRFYIGNEPQDPKPKHNLPSEEYLVLFTKICIHRRLFVTRKGHFGIGPEKTQPGDHVCVLEGGVVPVLLGMYREDKHSPDYSPTSMKFDKVHYFAGEAILGGFMYATDESLHDDEDSGRIQVREMILK